MASPAWSHSIDQPTPLPTRHQSAQISSECTRNHRCAQAVLLRIGLIIAHVCGIFAHRLYPRRGPPLANQIPDDALTARSSIASSISLTAIVSSRLVMGDGQDIWPQHARRLLAPPPSQDAKRSPYLCPKRAHLSETMFGKFPKPASPSATITASSITIVRMSPST